MRRAALVISLYATWTVVLRLALLSLLTYFLIPSHPRLHDISEAFSANEILIAALSSTLFIALLLALFPLTSSAPSDFFRPSRFEKFFIRGWIQGSLFALALTVAMLFTGYYRYVGFLVQVDEGLLVIGTVLLRILALVALVYVEEFLFRKKMLSYLSKIKTLPAWAAILLTAAAYCGVKTLQFDLGWMHLGSLFLVSILLAVRTQRYGDFLNGAGFWAATLVVFHALFGLPLFGNEFSGLMLIKYQRDVAATVTENSTVLFLTGGVGGPLSSFAFQGLILIQIISAAINIPELNPFSKSLK
jgi:hypothetical protein